jgi:hypothetical protein
MGARSGPVPTCKKSPDLGVLILDDPVTGIQPTTYRGVGELDDCPGLRGTPAISVGYGLNWAKQSATPPERATERTLKCPSLTLDRPSLTADHCRLQQQRHHGGRESLPRALQYVYGEDPTFGLPGVEGT